MYKNQWRIQRGFMNHTYKIFLVRVQKLQSTIPDTKIIIDYPNLSIKD